MLMSITDIHSHLTVLLVVHYENAPMQYTAIFYSCKNYYFHMKNFDFFSLIFAQNIDCGYTLEPPQ